MRKTIPCTYLKFDGTHCGKKCYRGLCSVHLDSAPRYPCLGCGRGTTSASGYCATPGPCLMNQRVAISRTYRASEKRVVEVKLDNFVDELFAELVSA